MFNIIDFDSSAIDPTKSGYEKLFQYTDSKSRINFVKKTEADNYKNKKTLILLDEYSLEEGAIRLIAEKKKACFLIDLSRVINTYGVTRAILFSKLRTFLKFCNKYGAYYTFADFARSEFDLRTARELMHISLLLGLNLGQAKFAMKMMKEYLE